MKRLEYSKAVINELDSMFCEISEDRAELFVDSVIKSKRIFVAGAGRSGFMVKAFAMRLMHIGFESYVVGETITPNIEKGDLLVIGSGSGETGSLVTVAEKAKNKDVTLALITIFPQSTIGKMADIIVRIPASTPKSSYNSGIKSIQPMGALFEQGLLLFLDVIVLKLMGKLGKDSEAMFTRHANLE